MRLPTIISAVGLLSTAIEAAPKRPRFGRARDAADAPVKARQYYGPPAGYGNGPPSYEPPSYEPPVYEPPVYEPPVYDPPAPEPPVYEPPVYEPPAPEPPVYEPPAPEPPVYEPPAPEPPVYEPPAPEPPVYEPPVPEPSVYESPVYEPPNYSIPSVTPTTGGGNATSINLPDKTPTTESACTNFLTLTVNITTTVTPTPTNATTTSISTHSSYSNTTTIQLPANSTTTSGNTTITRPLSTGIPTVTWTSANSSTTTINATTTTGRGTNTTTPQIIGTGSTRETGTTILLPIFPTSSETPSATTKWNGTATSTAYNGPGTAESRADPELNTDYGYPPEVTETPYEPTPIYSDDLFETLTLLPEPATLTSVEDGTISIIIIPGVDTATDDVVTATGIATFTETLSGDFDFTTETITATAPGDVVTLIETLIEPPIETPTPINASDKDPGITVTPILVSDYTPTPTLIIDTLIQPITQATLGVTPTTSIPKPTETACNYDVKPGKPKDTTAYCNVRGEAIGNYFLAEFVEERAGVPISLEGCYQFCQSSVRASEGCQAYRYFDNGLGSPRCALYGMPVARDIRRIDPAQPDRWFDLACGSPTEEAWLFEGIGRIDRKHKARGLWAGLRRALHMDGFF